MSDGEIEDVSKTYLVAFRPYTDQQILDANRKYSETGEYFPPKPAQIISLIKDIEADRHTKELIERYTCKRCGMKVPAISEGICLDCMGIPKPVYENIKPLAEGKGEDYKIEGRMKCNYCGKVGMAINEPLGSEGWECRECYSEKTTQQIAAEFRKLAGISCKVF